MIIYTTKRFGKMQDLRNFKFNLIANLLHTDNFITYNVFAEIPIEGYCRLYVRKTDKSYLCKYITNEILDSFKTNDDIIKFVNEIEKECK